MLKRKWFCPDRTRVFQGPELRAQVETFRSLALAAGAWAAVMWPMQASSQVLRCHIQSSDQTLSLELRPSQDVYDVRSLDFENGFRFSAVWLASQQQLKTYVHFSLKKKRMLISQQVLTIPPTHCTSPFAQQMVYAGTLERELHMACHTPCD